LGHGFYNFIYCLFQIGVGALSVFRNLRTKTSTQFRL